MNNTAKVSDIEFRSDLSKALTKPGGNGEFGLLLAMLHQDYLQRTRVATGNERDVLGYYESMLNSIDFYPKTPLATEEQHWRQQQAITAAVHQLDLSNARLLHCMHPGPLSVFNDVTKVSEEVLANCDLHAQQRYRESVDREIEVDETGLYEVIEETQAQLPKITLHMA